MTVVRVKQRISTWAFCGRWLILRRSMLSSSILCSSLHIMTPSLRNLHKSGSLALGKVSTWSRLISSILASQSGQSLQSSLDMVTGDWTSVATTSGLFTSSPPSLPAGNDDRNGNVNTKEGRVFLLDDYLKSSGDVKVIFSL